MSTRHTGRTYDAIAGKYAASVDSRPWNAYYERPATLSLLPELKDLIVLDAGCGPGWYAEYLLSKGAKVTALDFNREFVDLTQKRVGDRAKVVQADLAEPLNFAETNQFDLIVCPLALHYLEDWLPTLREFHRVLRDDGTLVFSTHHPFSDWKLSKMSDYYATELIEDEWDWLGKVQFFRHSLTAICGYLHDSGFSIDRLLEPKPTADFQRANPAEFDRVSREPWFLIIRGRKSALS